jgi:23S rRNA G2445 N2-methylase RlmL
MDQLIDTVLLNIAISTKAKGIEAIVTGELSTEVIRDICAIVEASRKVEGAARTCRYRAYDASSFALCLGRATYLLCTILAVRCRLLQV